MNELLSIDTNASWETIAPHLDNALGELSEPHRDALMLRYFENKSLREVGARLGISEDAAQKCVSRAVESLRDFLTKRGVTMGASGLTIAVAANAVQAAPVGLDVTISAVTVATGAAVATTATTSSTATKFIAMTAIQKTLIAVTIVVALGTALFQSHRASRLGSEVSALQQHQHTLVEDIAQLALENEALSNRVTSLDETTPTRPDRLRELLRLRGELAVLRRQQRELETSVAVVKQISVTVAEDGSFFVAGERCSAGDLTSKLRQVVAKGATEVIVQNRDVSSNEFVTMVDACGAAGFQRTILATAIEQGLYPGAR